MLVTITHFSFELKLCQKCCKCLLFTYHWWCGENVTLLFTLLLLIC